MAGIAEEEEEGGAPARLSGLGGVPRGRQQASQFAVTREKFRDIVRRPQDWLVKGMLPANGLAFLVGPSGAGKSFLAIDWSLRIACGQSVLDLRTERVGVVYIAVEAANGVRARVEAWRGNLKDDRPFELIAAPLDLRDDGAVAMHRSGLRSAAQDMVKAGSRLGLIVVDTLAAAVPGADENGSVDMSRAMTVLTTLAEEFDALVLVVCHTGKDHSRGLRGWSGMFAAADAVVMLDERRDDGLRCGGLTKLKDGADGRRFAFTLREVVIGTDRHGEEVTSAVVDYSDPRLATALGKALRGSERGVLEAVQALAAEQPPAANDHDQAERPWLILSAVKKRALDNGLGKPGEHANTVAQRWGRGLKSLQVLGRIVVEGERVRLAADKHD